MSRGAVDPRRVAVSAAAVVVLACAGCSRAQETPVAYPESTETSAPSAACGTFKPAVPSDPDGVLKTLPPAVQQAYDGYSTPIHASPWQNWKPPADGAVVGITWNAPVNDFTADTLNSIKTAVSQMPGVKKVVVLADADQADTSAQLAQFRSIVKQGVHLVIASTGKGGQFVPLVDAAAAAGIPTISMFTAIQTKNSVNVVPNNYLAAAQTAAAAVTKIGRSGVVLQVHGIQGISVDWDAFRAFESVLENCPDIRLAGTLVGGFAPEVAKEKIVKFLVSNPAKIDVVLQAGGMTTGIIGAFEDSGRNVPIVNDVAAMKGSLGYWLSHRSSYTGFGTGGGAEAYAELVSSVVRRMLAGDGLRVADIVQPQPIIDDDNIGQWAKPAWNLATAGTAPNPAGSYDYGPILRSVFVRGGS